MLTTIPFLWGLGDDSWEVVGRPFSTMPGTQQVSSKWKLLLLQQSKVGGDTGLGRKMTSFGGAYWVWYLRFQQGPRVERLGMGVSGLQRACELEPWLLFAPQPPSSWQASSENLLQWERFPWPFFSIVGTHTIKNPQLGTQGMGLEEFKGEFWTLEHTVLLLFC